MRCSLSVSLMPVALWKINYGYSKSRAFAPVFSPKHFEVLNLTLKKLIHFELTSLCLGLDGGPPSFL